ncbi:MAG: FlgD immunoglobulin-like domain containing protein [bacterium]|nr:FlgD immunoglobulin-like domain containing protein [bacterium]
MRHKYLLTIIVIFCIMLSWMSLIFSDTNSISIEEGREKAHFVAKMRWGDQVKINNGITFYDQQNNPLAYMFAIYRGERAFPAENVIMANVAKARTDRLRAEERLEQAIATNNIRQIQFAQQEIENAWQRMRDEKKFATVVVSANPPYSAIEAYSGLPLNFVAFADAEDRAAMYFGSTSKFIKVQNIMTGLFGYYSVFRSNNETCWINLKTLDNDTEVPFGELEFDPQAPVTKDKNDQHIFPNLMAEVPPFEYKISGVPDYQSSYRHCAQYAAGRILGYWHSRGYPRLIYKGNPSNPGTKDCNPATTDSSGYNFLCWCELADAMHWSPSGTPINMIHVGIIDLCNDRRNYSFQSVQMGPAAPDAQYTFIRSEIRAGRSFVYTLKYSTYGGGSGYHSVSLIGYGADLYDSFHPDLNNAMEKASSAQVAWFYICHDNNSTTGVDVYLYWSNFMSNAYIHTIVPGGSYNLSTSSKPGSIIKRDVNFPNPFNPETNIAFELSEPSVVDITITNVTGNVIKKIELGKLQHGSHQVKWNGDTDSGAKATTGVYFYQIQAGKSKQTGRMLLIK